MSPPFRPVHSQHSATGRRRRRPCLPTGGQACPRLPSAQEALAESSPRSQREPSYRPRPSNCVSTVTCVKGWVLMAFEEIVIDLGKRSTLWQNHRASPTGGQEVRGFEFPRLHPDGPGQDSPGHGFICSFGQLAEPSSATSLAPRAPQPTTRRSAPEQCGSPGRAGPALPASQRTAGPRARRGRDRAGRSCAVR